MKKALLLIFLTVTSIQIGFSQSLDTIKLNQYFSVLDSNNKFMGSVALMKDGEIVYQHQIGYADIETQQKPNENTKYRIGSISKTFTATMVFKAIEEGKLSLEKTLDHYFPEIDNSNTITIGNLLNHRSGIYNFTDDKKYLKYNTEPKDEKEMLAIISKYKSDFEPNSKAQYSNSNYVLLSYILEKTYEKSFSKILKEKIINPLDLKHTAFGGKINLNNNEANSYVYNEEWEKQTETDMSIPLGAGSVISKPADLLKFADALFSFKIISESSVTQMKKIEDNYGSGLFKMPFNEKFSFGHSGGIDGFSSLFGYFEDEKSAFALTANGSAYSNNQIAIASLSALFNKPYDIPSFTVYEVESEDLDQYIGLYSDPSFPLKITISKKKEVLMAQATGQSAFKLTAIAKDKFEFKPAGIILLFDPTNKQMTLEQGGGTYKLTRE